MKKCRIRNCNALAAPHKPEEPDMAGLCKEHQARQADRWANAGQLRKTTDFSTVQTHGWKDWQDAVSRMPAGGPYDYRATAESLVSTLLETGEEDVDDDSLAASVAQSAMQNTPFAQARNAYEHHYSIYKDGPEAWKHVLYEMGIWVPGDRGANRVAQLAYDLDRFKREFKAGWKLHDLKDYVPLWLKGRVETVIDNPAQVQAICQLWVKLVKE